MTNTAQALLNFVNDYGNDLQGFQRTLVQQNLQTVIAQQNEFIRLLELVVEDNDDSGVVSQDVINQIKDIL